MSDRGYLAFDHLLAANRFVAELLAAANDLGWIVASVSTLVDPEGPSITLLSSQGKQQITVSIEYGIGMAELIAGLPRGDGQ